MFDRKRVVGALSSTDYKDPPKVLKKMEKSLDKINTDENALASKQASKQASCHSRQYREERQEEQGRIQSDGEVWDSLYTSKPHITRTATCIEKNLNMMGIIDSGYEMDNRVYDRKKISPTIKHGNARINVLKRWKKNLT